jgi:simple sugar transport system permease protein
MTDIVDVEEGAPIAEPIQPSPRRSSNMEAVALYGGSILLALLISAFLVTSTGGSLGQVFRALLDGAVMKPGRWGNTLATAAPLLLVALGTIIAYRAGLVNIGQEGQLMMGAALAAFVGTRLSGYGPLLLVLALVAGIAGGATWAGIAAGMRLRKVPEVISTLLLVTVAYQIGGFFVSRTYLLLDPDPNRPNRVQVSAQLSEDVRLPQLHLFGNDIPISVLIAVALAIGLGFVLTRTIWGFRLRVLGHNSRAAQRMGVSSRKAGNLALILSGAFAGFAGSLMFTGGVANYTFTPGFANNIGWEGLLVALVARNHPIIVIPMAVIFAALRTGAGFLASTGVERKIVDVVQALLVLALLVPPAILYIRQRRRAMAAVRSRV